MNDGVSADSSAASSSRPSGTSRWYNYARAHGRSEAGRNAQGLEIRTQLSCSWVSVPTSLLVWSSSLRPLRRVEVNSNVAWLLGGELENGIQELLETGKLEYIIWVQAVLVSACGPRNVR